MGSGIQIGGYKDSSTGFFKEVETIHTRGIKKNDEKNINKRYLLNDVPQRKNRILPDESEGLEGTWGESVIEDKDEVQESWKSMSRKNGETYSCYEPEKVLGIS